MSQKWHWCISHYDTLLLPHVLMSAGSVTHDHFPRILPSDLTRKLVDTEECHYLVCRVYQNVSSHKQSVMNLLTVTNAQQYWKVSTVRWLLYCYWFDTQYFSLTNPRKNSYCQLFWGLPRLLSYLLLFTREMLCRLPAPSQSMSALLVHTPRTFEVLQAVSHQG